jgi:signal transduction histidine kinase
VRAVAGLARDITERKRAEQLQRFLKRASEVLAASLQRDEIVAALGKLVVPDFGDCCAIELVNDAGVSELAGVEHIDLTLAAIARDRWANAGRPLLAQAIRTARSQLFTELPEGLLPGLGLRSLMIVPMAAQGRTLGAIGLGLTARGTYRQGDLRVAEELADRAAMALEHARLYREAQAAVRARESMLAIVSHDLKNPLGAIGMSTALLLRRAGGEEVFQRHLQIIRRSAERMVRLIDTLLDLASVQAGRLAIVKERHAAQALLAEACELNEAFATDKGLTQVCESQLTDEELLCDRERVLQVFANLIGNAIKFSEPGGRITLRATRRDGWIQFEVSDTGPGIPAADVKRLFEPFWSGRRHAKKGTGLGLYITRGIVEAHGGRIWVQSRERQGATFFFTLPLASGHARAEGGVAAPPSH